MGTADQPTGTIASAENSSTEKSYDALIPFLTKVHHVAIAHGTIMCLAFVIFFPAGSFLIRLGHFKGVVYVHAGIQIFAYLMALAGMGMGVWLAHAPTEVGMPSRVPHAPQSPFSPKNQLRLI